MRSRVETTPKTYGTNIPKTDRRKEKKKKREKLSLLCNSGDLIGAAQKVCRNTLTSYI